MLCMDPDFQGGVGGADIGGTGGFILVPRSMPINHMHASAAPIQIMYTKNKI